MESKLQLSPEVCKMESKRLKSPYTINYYGIYQDEPTICVFVMPHCDCVDWNGVYELWSTAETCGM